MHEQHTNSAKALPELFHCVILQVSNLGVEGCVCAYRGGIKMTVLICLCILAFIYWLSIKLFNSYGEPSVG